MPAYLQYALLLQETGELEKVKPILRRGIVLSERFAKTKTRNELLGILEGLEADGP